MQTILIADCLVCVARRQPDGNGLLALAALVLFLGFAGALLLAWLDHRAAKRTAQL